MKLDFHSTRLFPKKQGADKYEITGIAARCDWVILTDPCAPQHHVHRAADTDEPRHIFLSLRKPFFALNIFAKNILPKLKAPFILISGSEDVTFPTQTDKRWKSFGNKELNSIQTILANPYLKHWAAENLNDARHPKLRPLPVGMVFNDHQERAAAKVPDVPPLASRPLRMLCSHRVRDGEQWDKRRKVSQIARKSWSEWCTYLDEEVSSEEFFDQVSRHSFVLCVEGGGIDPSPKAWQAILYGAIPIIRRTALYDAYKQLPVAFVDSWGADEIMPEKLAAWREALKDEYDIPERRKEVLTRLGGDYWWNLITDGEESVTPMSVMADLEKDIESSKEMRAGADNYRAYVGPPAQYDFMGATQFSLLFALGLREEHSVLDVGCGSLRAGRLLMQYLMPGRYFGVEPNEWLWRDAIRSEIGDDVMRLKQPTFTKDDTFSLTSLNKEFDFVVAQSVLSHTGKDMFIRPLHQAAKVLKPKGQFLFTVLDETTQMFSRLKDGRTAPGWHYPACVTYPEKFVMNQCAAAGLHVQPLEWFHPRQRWYRAVKSPDFLLKKVDIKQMGTGRPLYDDRFE